MATGERGGSSGLEQPAEAIEVTLFRQILLVPFAIEAAGDEGRMASGRDRVAAIARSLAEPWHEVTASRWRHLPGDAAAEGEALAEAYAELAYFEPAVQRYLFGRPGEEAAEAPIRLWRRLDVRALDVTLGRGEAAERWNLRVDRLNLYLFDTGNAILAVELAFDPAMAPQDGRAGAQPSLAAVMRLIERVRRVFPPYFERREGALVPGYFLSRLHWVADPPLALAEGPDRPSQFIEQAAARLIPPLHRAWRAILQPLALDTDCPPPDSFHLSQLGDDRAFSIAVVGVTDIAAITEPDWVRLAMCDGPGHGWPYDPGFLKDWHRRQAYDRHLEGGTRYLFSGYSFSMVGTARWPEEKEFCFFRDVLAGHGRRHYFQLCLIAYLQKSALLTLSERLADATLPAERSAEAAHAIERDILKFTHRYWFETLSAQVQAQEIFELLRDNLSLRALYRQVRQEVREADAFATGGEQHAMARNQNRLNIIAGVGLTLAVIAGFFGMNVFDSELQPNWGIDAFLLLCISGGTLAGFAALYAGADAVEKSLARHKRMQWLMISVPFLIGGIGLIGLLFR